VLDAEIENKNQNPKYGPGGRPCCGGSVLPLSEPPTISIVIPVHNGGPAFRRCLASVCLLRPAPLEVIVVVDGDADDSAQVAACFKTQIIRLSQRGGPARARNQGAFRAKGEIVLFLDADVVAPPGLLEQVAEDFRAASDTAAIIGSYDAEPAAEGLISEYKNLMHHYVHQYSAEQTATFWGACGAIRRDVFVAVGGFDERYRRPCVEDIDLGYRLRAAQCPVRLRKSLQVKHLKRWTFLSLLKADIFDRALPWTELIIRHRIFPSDLNLRHSDRFSVAAMYTLLMTLPLTVRSPAWGAISGSLGLLLLILNRHTYGFFFAHRGMAFAAAAVALHWLSLIYSGMAFALGIVRYGIVLRVCSVFSGRTRHTEPYSPGHQPKHIISSLGNSGGGGA
jgi:glycosyltransferase involved in cell wall biosynthesis